MTPDTPETMKAVAVDEFGGVEKLDLKTLPVPEPGPDDVLIRLESVGVGVWDPVEREGLFHEMYGLEPDFPHVIGFEGSGTVAAVGGDVTRFEAGDRVYAARYMNPAGGFYAEYAAVDADYVSIVPDELTVRQAGAMPVDALTALQGLDDTMGLEAGESVLIFGASGGVGHLAVQLARRMGARVFAAASGNDGVSLVERLGADAVVDGRRVDVAAAARDFAPDGLDAALLTAGGEAAERALQAVRDGGRVAYPNGVRPEPTGRPRLRIDSYDGAPGREAIEKLDRLIASGATGAVRVPAFDVHVARTFPLERAADAHRALGEHFLGKLALLPG